MNRKWKKVAALTLCGAMTCGMLAGCGGSNNSEETAGAGSSQAANSKVELTYCVNSSNASAGVTTDPAVDYTLSGSVWRGICETLLALDDDTKEVKPVLATDYEQVDDLTWVFTIRDGIEFTNGNPLNAEACKTALEYIFNNNTRLGTMADVASIEADGQKLTIRTNEIVAILPRILTEPNTAIFDTTASDDYSKGLIGTGPYILDSMDGEGNCELSKNENYWQGEPAADLIHTKADLDASAVTLAMQSGELDWASIKDADLALFENNDDYQILEQNAGRVYYFYVNPNYTYTQDPAVREALTYAFDRQAILDGVYSGHGEITQSIFPSWSGFYTEEYQQVSYNQEKAKAILAEAGYADTDGDGFLDKDGENIKLNITYYDKNGFKTLSEVAQSMLKAIGIDSEIVGTESIADDLMSGEYNLGTYGYNTLTLGDCYNYLQPVFETGASSNFTKFSNENVDALLKEMKVTADESKREELAKEIQQYIYEADEHIFLLHIINYTVAKKEVQNIEKGVGGDQVDPSKFWKVTK